MNRTNQQNKSYWKWLTLLANELNNSGQTMGDGVLIRVPLYYTAESLHERVCKPYLHAMYPDKVSTTQLETTQLQELYRNLDLIISERSGCHVEWPSLESLSNE